MQLDLAPTPIQALFYVLCHVLLISTSTFKLHSFTYKYNMHMFIIVLHFCILRGKKSLLVINHVHKALCKLTLG